MLLLRKYQRMVYTLLNKKGENKIDLDTEKTICEKSFVDELVSCEKKCFENITSQTFQMPTKNFLSIIMISGKVQQAVFLHKI